MTFFTFFRIFWDQLDTFASFSSLRCLYHILSTFLAGESILCESQLECRHWLFSPGEVIEFGMSLYLFQGNVKLIYFLNKIGNLAFERNMWPYPVQSLIIGGILEEMKFVCMFDNNVDWDLV